MRGRPAGPVRGTKLHVGCGPSVYDGWVNIDKSPSVLLSRFGAFRRLLLKLGILTAEQARGFPPGVLFADVSRRIPADSDSVACIYCSHMIEHLSRRQALSFVVECERVLRPGGVLRLATPDLALMVRDYLDHSSPLLGECGTPADAFCEEYGAYADPPGKRITRLVRKLAGGDSHQWLYDAESLAKLLNESGFTQVERCGYREGEVPELDRIEHRERSLFMEARKAPVTA